jgi:hypothetical protein
MAFQDIELKWKGVVYRIDAQNVMAMILKIEEVVTLAELVQFRTTRNIKFGKVSAAYGIALRNAGANIIDDDVYAGMFDADTQLRILSALDALLTMMVPLPQHQEKEEGKKKAEGTETAAASLSKKHSKRPSPGA